jgi:putative hydrolase of the HAD superfamily
VTGPIEPVEATLFDLDDTLFLQEHWLAGAWAAVADAGAIRGLDREALHSALVEVASKGSGGGRIVDRALALVSADDACAAPLVTALRAYRAPFLPCLPAVREALAELRSVIPIGLVTDGDVSIQRGKIASLDLVDAFDVIIYSDDLGRECRKPSPWPFLAALARLGISPCRAVFVGDRPDKDIAGAGAVGMRAVRVHTGEYATWPDAPRPWASSLDAVEAIGLIKRQLDSRARTRTTGAESSPLLRWSAAAPPF